MAERILVTEKEYFKGRAVFDAEDAFEIKCAPIDEAALAKDILTQNSRAIIVGVDTYTLEIYEALRQTGSENGAIIARFGVGHDGIDKDLARTHNIVVTNTPGVLDRSVAEHAVWLMGAVARNIGVCDTRMRAGEFFSEMGMQLFGKTLGIVGFGAIGRLVAAIAHFGLGMRVVAADIKKLLPQEFGELSVVFGLKAYSNNVNEVLDQADVISIHLPSRSDTYHFFNAERLAVMKPNSVLINTARGLIVEECALYDALTGGHLRGVGLDVFEREPYVPVNADKDLRRLPNVVLTPHVGSNTDESNNSMATTCLRNIRSFFAGRIDELTTVGR